MLSTFETESEYIAFNVNLTRFELAPLHQGRGGAVQAQPRLESALLSTLEPESECIVFNVNLTFELAPLQQGRGRRQAHTFRQRAPAAGEVGAELGARSSTLAFESTARFQSFSRLVLV